MTGLSAKKRAVFLHPSLGLGGAERLILQASAALRKGGWSTVFLTAEYDPLFAFDEAQEQEIRVVRNRIPSAFAGRLKAWCAFWRMKTVVAYLRGMETPDLIVVDLVPHVIPLVRRWFPDVPVLVYCHFPDQLLAPTGSSWYRWYRSGFDRLEKEGLEAADFILTNSLFTREKLIGTYPSLGDSRVEVLYPGVRLPAMPEGKSAEERSVILTLSRLHPSKNLELALKAFASSRLPDDARLIVAGGWDPGDSACRHEADRLRKIAIEIGIDGRVEWLFNPSDVELEALWQVSRMVLYPPLEEHFGLVPLEAMARGVPVVAVNAGGPKEIIIDGVTGFLCDARVEDFTRAVEGLWSDLGLWTSCSEAARSRVAESFDLARFEQRFQDVSACLTKTGSPRQGAS